jgi:DNA modification methylase
MNRIMHGDNLAALRHMETASAALIYIDPPFNTGRRQTRLRMKTVQDDAGDRVGFGGRRYRTELVNNGEQPSDQIDGYADRFDDFLGFLRPRLIEAHRILTPTGKEKTGYATQKPLGILERIVRVHSNPGDLVLDFFAGSGTTGEAAAKNNRAFCLIDENTEAIAVMEKRLQIKADSSSHGAANQLLSNMGE